MNHVHRIIKHFPRPGRTVEELASFIAEHPGLYTPGQVCATNYLPYPQGTLIEVRAEVVNGEVVETKVYEPTSGAALEKYWAERRVNWRENHGPIDEELEVDWMAEQKLQEDWVKGVAADATIFCVVEQKDRAWHGHAVYGETVVCNECMRRIERAIVTHELVNPHEWIEARKEAALIENFIDKCEERGEDLKELPDGRWAQVAALYTFYRHSEYRADVYAKPHL